MEEGALPARELAARARIAPSTASGHLARLVEGRLLSGERRGRHRYFRLRRRARNRSVEITARGRTLLKAEFGLEL